MSNEVKIQCDTKLFVAMDSLHEFQGELKSLSEVNFQKLRKQILENGFSSPILVWKNDGKYFILDGHQRVRTCKKLKTQGYKVPDLPCVEIFAKTKLEAKKKLLSYVSQFGKVEGQGLYEFIMEAEIPVEQLEEYQIPELNMEDFKKEFFDHQPDAAGDEPDMSDDKEILVTVTFMNELEAEDFYNDVQAKGFKCKLIT